MKRNEPNDQNNRNYQNSIPKKLIKIQWMPWGFRRQPSYSSGLARLWSTPDLPHGEIPLSLITISLMWGVEGTFLKKIINKVMYIDVVNETVFCFFLSSRFGIQFGWRFVLKTTYKCLILVSAARVVVKKKRFRETAIIFKTLNERESSSFHRRST